MLYLVINLGSSSLKLAALESIADCYLTPPQPIWTKSISGNNDQEIQNFLEASLSELPNNLDRIVHRVVHGGCTLTKSKLLDHGVIEEIRSLSHLAPIHQPRSLKLIELSLRLFSQPQFAAFDTAFFADLPEASRTYALAKEINDLGIRRFGFHGLSHSYAMNRASALTGEMPQKLITLHLGSGSSISAIKNGKPIFTSMGFTPLEGLVMGTRCGSIDPGIVIQLAKTMEIAKVEELLTKKSGLLGLSQKTSDMRELLALAAAKNLDAVLAYDVFLNSLIRQVGECYALLDGCDCLTFTGGIGENSSKVREDLLAKCSFLPQHIVTETKQKTGHFSFVIEAREDLEMINSVEHL